MRVSCRFALTLTMVCCADSIAAQPAPPAAAKHDATILRGALKDVVNAGAELFNKDGDHAGCYRLYQGALISLKPFLPPVTQKEIEDALAAAEMLPRYSDRAFALRKVINTIRAQAAQAVPKAASSQGGSAKVSGNVMFDGKPAPAGYLTLVAANQRRFSTIINQNGTYAFPTPIPAGHYAIAIERTLGQKSQGPDVPARYRSEQSSGLVVDVRPGTQVFDVQLQD